MSNTKFRVYCETSFGQTVHIVGSVLALGNWKPTEANKLQWTEHNWWQTPHGIGITLPPGAIEYKYVIKDQNGAVYFEGGNNRSINVNGSQPNNVLDVWDRRKEIKSYPETLSIKIMSFNIRYDTEQDGKYRWANRKDIVSEIVKGSDIFSLQEPLLHQIEDVKHRVGNAFNYVAWGRNDGHQSGEMTPIFYRPELFNLESCGVFWLSKSPNQPGSHGWNAPLPRICSWARFKPKKRNSSPFYVFNTHLDYMSFEARRQGLRLILSKMTAIANGAPCVLMGDFNSMPSEKLVAEITQDSCADQWGVSLVNAGAGNNDPTFVGFENNEPMLIDYILVTKNILAQEFKILPNGTPGKPASDHCAITTVITV